jgi:hypothetical protein
MRFLTAISALALVANPIAAPLFAQGNAAMTYDDRITCSALLFLSSQGAEDPRMEEQFAAHHLSKAIEMSGRAQADAIADTERRMEDLRPAWDQQDSALEQTFSTCIMTVMTEMSG